ncbi:hypothetical protein DXG01_007088 [Tephrocybe rancida]|nr:hypothetical protein DXG01_007088 [Tephrocybe rancida]
MFSAAQLSTSVFHSPLATMKDTSTESSNQYPAAPPAAPAAPPHLYHDDAGAPYIQDPSGHFVLYYGPFPVRLPSWHSHLDAWCPPIPSMPLGASSSRPPVIDPSLSALPPLPDTSDDDLTNGPTIAKAHGYTSAPKVAGSHQKDKGKQCAVEPSSKGKQHASKPSSSWKRKVVIPSSNEEEDEPDSKRGRPRSAGNYNNADTAHLLDLIEAERPLGQKGWLTVGRRFNIWALKNGHPDRTPKLIEMKFKQLAKTTMPTGDGYCPPEVKRAHAIELLINEHACTRDLDDDDFDGGVKRERPPPSNELGSDDDLDDDEIEIINTPAPKVVCGTVVHHPDPLSSCHKSRVNSLDLVSKLTDTFDPAAVKARDTECAECSFSNTQFITLSQQLRDYQNINKTLRRQVTQLQDRLHEAERAQDCFELQLDMHKLTQSRGPNAHSYPKRTHEYIADHRDGHT